MPLKTTNIPRYARKYFAKRLIVKHLPGDHDQSSHGNREGGKEETITAYHGTAKEYLGSIKKEGIILGSRTFGGEDLYQGKRGESIYLTAEKRETELWAYNAVNAAADRGASSAHRAVLEIEIPESHWGALRDDEAVDHPNAMRIELSNIPSDWIKAAHIPGEAKTIQFSKARAGTARTKTIYAAIVWPAKEESVNKQLLSAFDTFLAKVDPEWKKYHRIADKALPSVIRAYNNAVDVARNSITLKHIERALKSGDITQAHDVIDWQAFEEALSKIGTIKGKIMREASERAGEDLKRALTRRVRKHGEHDQSSHGNRDGGGGSITTYHGTRKAYLDSIKDKGLIIGARQHDKSFYAGGKGESIFLSSDLEGAWIWAGGSRGAFNNEKVALEIEIPESHWSFLHDDENLSEPNRLRIELDRIPPEWIKTTYTYEGDNLRPTKEDDFQRKPFAKKFERVRKIYAIIILPSNDKIDESSKLSKADDDFTYIPGVGLTNSFNLRNEAAEQWIRLNSAQLVTQVGNEAKAAIREILLDAFQNGGHPYRTARTIRNLVGLRADQVRAILNYRAKLEAMLAAGRSPYRTQPLTPEKVDDIIERYAIHKFKERGELIARTETIAAAAQGQLEIWRQAHDLMPTGTKKKWIVTPDDRLCELCAAMDDQEVDLGEDFESPDGVTVSGPTLHPNCRCAMRLTFPDLEEVEVENEIEIMEKHLAGEHDQASHAGDSAGERSREGSKELPSKYNDFRDHEINLSCGISHSEVAFDKNGDKWFLKYGGGKAEYGRREAAAEQLAYQMGERLGLDMPDTVIFQDKIENPSSPGEQPLKWWTATRDVREDYPNAQTIQDSRRFDLVSIGGSVIQTEDWQKMKLFDELIGNNDRHAGNYLVNENEGKILNVLPIDQSRAFEEFGDAPDSEWLHRVAPDIGVRMDFAETLSSIKPEEVDGWMATMPKELLDSMGMSSNDLYNYMQDFNKNLKETFTP